MSSKKCCDKYTLEKATVKASKKKNTSLILFFASDKYLIRAEASCPSFAVELL